MKGKLSIIFISMLAAVIFMTGGYGHWEKDVTIDGTITVVVPEPESDGATYVDSFVSTDANNIPENLQNVSTGTEGDTSDTSTTDLVNSSQSIDTKENASMELNSAESDITDNNEL